MRFVLVVGALLIAAVAVAAQLTVPEIIAAHRAGATPEGMLALVQSAESVAQVSPEDAAAMRAAGLPEAVIQTVLARAPQATPTPIPARPDNPALVDLVRLVRSGLSEKIVADQIRQSGVEVKPSLNDLIYLKENGIQEVIIIALMEAPVIERTPVVAPTIEPTPAPTPTPDPEPVFDGLILRRGVLAKNRAGQLTLAGNKLRWRDGRDASQNFELFMEGVKQVTVTCQPKQDGLFCYQLQFQFTRGDDYSFEDAQRDAGGNENLMLLINTLKDRIPALPFVEKAKT
jgi:hypothetical protein